MNLLKLLFKVGKVVAKPTVNLVIETVSEEAANALANKIKKGDPNVQVAVTSLNTLAVDEIVKHINKKGAR